MKIYTAGYRYAGDDRIDITAKGRDPAGKVFAPTWKMVMGVKEGTLTWEAYKTMYRSLMEESMSAHQETWETIMGLERVTLVCFCKPRTACHRYLLADMLQGLGADYRGERTQ